MALIGSGEATTSEESRLGELIEITVGKFKNRKSACNNEVTGELIK